MNQWLPLNLSELRLFRKSEPITPLFIINATQLYSLHKIPFFISVYQPCSGECVCVCVCVCVYTSLLNNRLDRYRNLKTELLSSVPQRLTSHILPPNLFAWSPHPSIVYFNSTFSTLVLSTLQDQPSY